MGPDCWEWRQWWRCGQGVLYGWSQRRSGRPLRLARTEQLTKAGTSSVLGSRGCCSACGMSCSIVPGAAFDLAGNCTKHTAWRKSLFRPQSQGDASQLNCGRNDLLFSISSASHKNHFYGCADQYEPGNAHGIASYYVGQIMIAVEDTAKALKEHNQQYEDTQRPFPEARGHFGNQQIRQQTVANHRAQGVTTWEGRNRGGSQSQLFRGSGAVKIRNDEIP